MARKRKSPVAEGSEEPEFADVQHNEPEFEPEPEHEHEPQLQDPDNQPAQDEENPGYGDGDEVDDMEENYNLDGAAQENNEEDINQKPSEDDAVLGNGDAAEGKSNNGEGEGEGGGEGGGGGEGEGQGQGQGQGQGEGDDGDEGELEEETMEKLLEPFSKEQVTLLLKEAAEKHPDVAESARKLADVDPAHRKIFVHGLGWEGNRESIVSEFGKYGEIDECKVVIDQNTGKSKGYGFILFKHRDGARRALKKPQKNLWGRSIWCQLASAGPVQAPPPNKVAAIPSTPMSEYTRRKIFVSNVSAEVDIPKLIEFFSEFGEIEEGPLGLDKTTGKPKGFCLFVYKSLASAQKVLKEPHKEFEGTILHCQKAIDGPKVGKGYDNYSHYGQPHRQPPSMWQPPQWAPPPRQQYHHQENYHHAPKRGRFGGGRGGGRRGGGNSKGRGGGQGPAPSGGLNHGVTPAAIGQAVAALMATQGSGAFLGGIGGMNPQGGPSMMNNIGGYAGQGAPSGYGGQPGMQGGYGGQPQMGQGGVRPPQAGGGAPYMGQGQ